MPKALSVVFVVGFFLLAVEYGPAGSVLPSALFIMVPLLGIWFPEELGAWLGGEGIGLLKVSRPTLWVQRIAWVLLLLSPLIPALL